MDSGMGEDFDPDFRTADDMPSSRFDGNPRLLKEDISEHSRLLVNAVAELTDECILAMSDEELSFAIRVARLPSVDTADPRKLSHLSRSALERMAFRARYVARTRLIDD